ncbi:hypothetical protein OTU49_008243, partial [Cherax quadricarinatus]
KGGCRYSGCKCCTSREASCPVSANCPGICMDIRTCKLPLNNYTCSGSDCMCCDKCNAQPMCNEGYGMCRQVCHSFEIEEAKGCLGADCKCCTPPKARCPPSGNCPGICMDIELCNNPLTNYRCTGPDCICCDKCSINPVCDDGLGVCREFCFNEEREVKDGDCGTSGCKCCTSRLADCPSSSNCSGICTDIRTCHYPLVNNFCSGLDCVCCHKCGTQQLCDDDNGVCRESCHTEERELEKGCSDSDCKCCTLREATCTPSSNCPGICMDSRKCKKPLNNSYCNG